MSTFEMPLPDHPALFDAIGGQPVVDAMVVVLFDKIMADDQLATYYAGADMDQVKADYRHFFTTAFNGPGEWRGRLMMDTHHGRGINDAEYTRWVEYAAGALREAGVWEGHIGAINAEVFTPLRPHIVGQ